MFSPVVRFTSVRAILAIAAAEKMTLRQFDVKTAFLYGELEEDVYMKQPIGFNNGSGKVCKLYKSLYGLKQASRCWNKKFSAFIEKFRFTACESDPCVFVRTTNGLRLLLAIYVDDGLITASNEKEPVIKYLQLEFEIKSFSTDCFLGLEIGRQEDGSIQLRQEAYGRKILRRVKMEECNGVTTPADSNQFLDDLEQLADIFTKGLPKDRFQNLRDLLNNVVIKIAHLMSIEIVEVLKLCEVSCISAMHCIGTLVRTFIE